MNDWFRVRYCFRRRMSEYGTRRMFYALRKSVTAKTPQAAGQPHFTLIFQLCWWFPMGLMKLSPHRVSIPVRNPYHSTGGSGSHRNRFFSGLPDLVIICTGTDPDPTICIILKSCKCRYPMVPTVSTGNEPKDGDITIDIHYYDF